MKVKKLIKKLSEFNPDLEVMIMKEKKNDDISHAYKIKSIARRILDRNDFENSEFPAIVISNLN